MNHNIFRLFLLGLFAMLIVGCGTATTPTPLPTQPPVVVTVIITATPPPPTATSPAPTVTPMPTLPLTTTVVAATPTQAVAKATTAPRPASTRTATKPAVAPTATALPIKFAAPSMIRPMWIQDGQKDEATYRTGSIEFMWRPIGGRGTDECFRLEITTRPTNPSASGARSDYWVFCSPDETRPDYEKFTLESPLRVGTRPNYDSIIMETDMWADYSLTVVKNLGECDPSYRFHCKTAPLSPPGRQTFLLKGGRQ
jgi:hypothetical protein